MEWIDIRDAADPELDRLAARFHLHAAHLSCCRAGSPHSVEQGPGYLFFTLPGKRSVFAGHDFLISVQGRMTLDSRLRTDEALRLILEDSLRENPAAARDIAAQLRDTDSGVIRREMRPWFRHIHSRAAEMLETAGTRREFQRHQSVARTHRFLKAGIALLGFIVVLLILLLVRAYSRGA